MYCSRIPMLSEWYRCQAIVAITLLVMFETTSDVQSDTGHSGLHATSLPPYFCDLVQTDVGVTINCTGRHWTAPYQARNVWLFRFDGELKGVSDELIIRSWPKEWTPVHARDELVMDVFNVSCLFSWSPSIWGSTLRLTFTRNSRWSKIIRHFWPSAVNSHTRQTSLFEYCAQFKHLLNKSHLWLC